MLSTSTDNVGMNALSVYIFNWGFMEGRQFGRGRTGGQVRDEYRMDYDPGRGGYGTILKNELSSRQQMMAALTMR